MMNEWKDRRHPDMLRLHEQTCRPENIHQTAWFSRYVNHDEKLATTGFGTVEQLERDASIIRFDTGTLKLMRERYAVLFPAKGH